MDINDLRSLLTLLVFAIFIGIVVWAYSTKRQRSFDQAANSVFDEDDAAARRDGGAGKQEHN
jgi:cytochrome c oxidase cbb3-type subunit 4